MPPIELPKLKCPRCGHEWTPRVPQPLKCPRCGHFLKRRKAGKSDDKPRST